MSYDISYSLRGVLFPHQQMYVSACTTLEYRSWGNPSQIGDHSVFSKGSSLLLHFYNWLSGVKKYLWAITFITLSTVTKTTLSSVYQWSLSDGPFGPAPEWPKSACWRPVQMGTFGKGLKTAVGPVQPENDSFKKNLLFRGLSPVEWSWTAKGAVWECSQL